MIPAAPVPDVVESAVAIASEEIERTEADELEPVTAVKPKREVIKAEDIRDYTITEGIAEKVARRFGASLANNFVDTLLRTSLR